MLKKLLILSLIAIPFYEIILYFLIQGRGFPDFEDLRVTKDFVSMAFACGIGSVVLCRYGINKVKNVWIPVFLVFLVFNMSKAPGSLIIKGVDFAGMWNYKPAFQLFAYFLLFLGVSNMYLDIKNIFKTIAYCGFAMTILMILQKLGLDQIFNILPKDIIGATPHPEMGGTVGHVTLSAPFIVMCLPFMVYLRKWILALIMCVVVGLSGSSFAVLGLAVTILTMILTMPRLKIQGKIIILVLLCISVGAFIYFTPDFLESNGRFPIWKSVFNDILTKKIAFTGAGVGSFKYLFALKNGNRWYQAHNEYLQLIWTCGLAGLFIFVMACKNMISHIFNNLTKENRTILASLFGIGAICIGTFPLQLAVYQYYLVVMIGIVYSSTLNRS